MKIQIPYAWGFKIYKSSPRPIRRLIDIALKPIPRSVMLGSGFHEKLKFLLKSEKWEYKKLVEFQERALRKLIEHAYRNVPYYHRIFRERGLLPSDIRKIEDLNKLPVLTKDDIRSNFSDLIAVNYKEFKPGLAYTSGSTGKPLEFYLDQQNREWEYASQWRQVFWGGIRNVNVKIATFRGDFVFEYGKTNKVARWHGLYKELIFNTYLLDPEHIKRMVEILNKFKPELIKGYPHALYIIAKNIEEMDLQLKFKPRVIQPSSEQLTLYMREVIERIFEPEHILDWYSQSEYVISIGQCELGEYHQTMETGIMSTIEDDWGFERLVGTGLWNYSMPFINYMIGDIIRTSNDIPKCGRNLTLVRSLEGRVNDIVITPSGKAISGVGFDHYVKHRIIHYLKVIPDYLHFIQTKLDEMVVEIYSSNPIPKGDIDLLIRELKLLLGDEMNIKIKYLDKLPKSKKWRIVESKVSKL
ncbi:putative protein coenzyme F390 synthetase-like protein [Pyrococcus sp. NA2]|uniref:phenylacetate--CoA ligase family protein n=1 Tax=Pyrococcus sp. (strain NA2) TaxID=342949 RepID=UPI000209A9FC|nr:phenylacetate--CoA ligase family protein [Pyrococcus sp. NA2]AEC51937.1 putative protein coenzyme F390 synthetase-like protein [Pyrococcus sp. NA2]